MLKGMERIRAFGHSTFSSLKIRNYRLFFIGQGISLCGSWMQTIALSWLVLQLTGSGTALGLVTAAQYLPILLFAPLGGVLADRFSKRKVLFFTAGALSLVALALGLLLVFHSAQLWMIYTLAVVWGLATALDNPTRQTFMHEMAGPEETRNAVALNALEVNLARFIGPAIAGVLIVWVGLAPLFLLNALSYAGTMVALLMINSSLLHRAPLVARAKGQLRQGFRYVWGHTELRTVLLILALVGTMAYEWQVSLPLLAEFVFHGGAPAFAALSAAQGIGAVTGGLVAARSKKTGIRPVAGGAALLGVALLMVSLTPNLFTALGGMFIVGACSITFVTASNATLQLSSSPEMRGRVMALWAVAFMGSTPIGGPIIGYIGQRLGGRWGSGWRPPCGRSAGEGCPSDLRSPRCPFPAC